MSLPSYFIQSGRITLALRTSLDALFVSQRDVPAVLPSPDHLRCRCAGGATPQPQVTVLPRGQLVRRVVQIHDVGRYHDLHVTGLRAKFASVRERPSLAGNQAIGFSSTNALRRPFSVRDGSK